VHDGGFVSGEISVDVGQGYGFRDGQSATLVVRPEDVFLRRPENLMQNYQRLTEGVVEEVSFVGAFERIGVRLLPSQQAIIATRPKTETTAFHLEPGSKVTVGVVDKALAGPNGITWDAAHSRFIVVPYSTDSSIKAWAPGTKTVSNLGKGSSTKYDGVEILSGGGVLVSSQGDSSLHLFTNGTEKPIIKTGGAPADIAVDTKRNRAAVPFVDRNAVEIWQLP